MSRIISAINAMISNPEMIKDVTKSYDSDDIFFTYDQKHKWSISRDAHNSSCLTYYPGAQSIQQLAGMENYEWSEFQEFIRYTTDEIGTSEAYESMGELYNVVKEKIYNMDKVLTEIIKTDEIPF